MLKFLSEVFMADNVKNKFRSSYNIDYEINNKVSRISPLNHNVSYLPSKIIVSSYSAFEPFNPKAPKNSSEVQYVYLGTLGQLPIGLPGHMGPFASLSSVCIPILETLFHNDLRKSTAINELLNEIGYVEMPLIQISFIQSENYLSSRLDTLRKNGITEDKIEEINYFLNRLHTFHRDFLNIKRVGGRHLIDPESLNHYYGGAKGWLSDVRHLANLPGGINIVKSLSFRKNNELVPLNKLSSGELSMFFRFFKLIDAISDDALVLIDEPETHLHPRWIQKYLSMINSIFGQYKAHFIVATHSPLIAADVPNECIIGLRKNTHGKVVQYQVQERTLGTSPQEILREVFGLSNQHGDFTNHTISQINELIDMDKIELAQALYNYLGESDEKFNIFLRLKKIRDKVNNNVEN